jgi:uncharacterized membrane protein
MSSKTNDYKEKATKTIEKIMDTEDKSKDFEKKDVESGKGMAALSYIIAPIPYFVEKSNKFVKYHARQGMDLFVIWIGYVILYKIITSVIKVNGSCGSWLGIELGNYCRVTPWWIVLPLSLVGLCISVIALIGLINAVTGKAKELPIVNKFKIFK